jgi:hypothetical protein
MTRSLLAILAAGAMLAPAVPAQAATSGPEFTRAGHKLAQCLYTKRKTEVVGALGASTAERASYYQTMLRNSPACSNVTVTTRQVEGASVSAPDDIMRGMYAEAALRDVRAAADLGPLSAEPSYTRDWFAATGRQAVVDEMAVCMAAQHPIGIRKLLGTAPESPEELEVIRALGGVLAPCLPQGATLKANRQTFRAALAEAFYHRATTPVLAAK